MVAQAVTAGEVADGGVAAADAIDAPMVCNLASISVVYCGGELLRGAVGTMPATIEASTVLPKVGRAGRGSKQSHR